jgi:hypothetical protein
VSRVHGAINYGGKNTRTVQCRIMTWCVAVTYLRAVSKLRKIRWLLPFTNAKHSLEIILCVCVRARACVCVRVRKSSPPLSPSSATLQPVHSHSNIHITSLLRPIVPLGVKTTVVKTDLLE